ncbi:MAG TPA: UDP-N-acetylmuramoyl-L-alanine--D-glutamate ligase, partial [Clostridiales bacterium]|nr:UDP-N-acetylmuramoyl-L-alanine--D-glutamate ligase [Clostridiales bacterium]
FDDVVSVAHSFGGVEHRLELVRTRDGVRYYNDSIASSPTRTAAGLRAFDQKVILLAGGHDKKIPYDSFGPIVCDRVKRLILIDANPEDSTAPAIEAAVRGAENFNPEELTIERYDDFEAAVRGAAEAAEDGDIVLLSPASASFDIFKNFMERGNRFKDIVNAL